MCLNLGREYDWNEFLEYFETDRKYIYMTNIFFLDLFIVYNIGCSTRIFLI